MLKGLISSPPSIHVHIFMHIFTLNDTQRMLDIFHSFFLWPNIFFEFIPKIGREKEKMAMR